VTATPDIPGHTLSNVIGKGGFATVYRGWQLAVGRDAATVTLASGSSTLSKTFTISANAWNRVSMAVGTWPYRGHVIGISVTYRAIPSPQGVNTGWNQHFQIDDVGYTT
jgi:hypothetical protein